VGSGFSTACVVFLVLSNTRGGMQAFAGTNHLIPTEKLLLIVSPGGMLCVSASIGWCKTQNNIFS